MTDDDVFQESGPAVVDCDILEAAKENVQPLVAGRRVTALSSVLATPHALRESKLSATRNKLRINVEIALDDEDDDALEAYSQLVYWTLENYPEGNSKESGLVELLEESTRVLKDNRDRIWRTELKYLKLWLLYATYVHKPTIIHRFCLANEIGTNHALLYEDYSLTLERERRRKEADEIYKLGIARRAMPLEHLKTRYADFQKRMLSPASAPAQTPAAPPSIPSSRSSRPILATTSGSSSIVQPSRLPRPNASVPIFVDPSGSRSGSTEFETNAWPDIGTRVGRIKENVPETKKMEGTTIRQVGKSKRQASVSSASSRIVPFRDPPPDSIPQPAEAPKRKAPAKSAFAIFVDVEEPNNKEEKAVVPPPTPNPTFTPYRDVGDVATTSPSRPTHESLMKSKKIEEIPSSESEILRKNPLKNYGILEDEISF